MYVVYEGHAVRQISKKLYGEISRDSQNRSWFRLIVDIKLIDVMNSVFKKPPLVQCVRAPRGEVTYVSRQLSAENLTNQI